MLKLVISFCCNYNQCRSLYFSVQDSHSTPYEGPFEDDDASDSSVGLEDDDDASMNDSSGHNSYGVRESAAETLNSDAALAAEIDQFITSGNWDIATVDSDVVRVAEIDQLIKSGNWDVSTFN
jgi:hypothetical protein